MLESETQAREAWLKRVEATLKGAGFEEKLVARVGGLRIEPLHGRIAGPRADRGGDGPWTVHQRIDHPNPARANAQALDDLANGATGLTVVCTGAAMARGFGADAAAFPRILDGVALHAIALRLEGDEGAARELARFVGRQPLDPERLDISFGLPSAGLLADLRAQGFRGPFLEADGRPWHETGCAAEQELAAVLAEAVAHLRASQTPSAIGVTLAADQDMFLTLAKFRAMRLLWARVLEASGLAQEPLRIHGETSFRMMATLDPHTNILRCVAAVFGAGLGGADSLTVLPFSIAQGLPNAFARRVARNLQTILIEESNLWRIADPASGAGYVETLTQDLCGAAWRGFQDIEKGGAWPSPDPANTRSLPAIGTSVFPLPEEYRAEVEVPA